MFRLKTATRRSTAGISTVAKQFCLFIVLLALSTMAHSQVRPEYSGSWYNAKQSGHGFSIEVITADSSIVYWYTYDPFGYPIFLVGDGKNVGNRIEAEVYGYYGMVFGEFDPRTREQVYWGTLTITFHHCSRATLRYDSALRYQTGESFGSGEISLVRLSSMAGFRCSDFPLVGVYAGYVNTDDGRIYEGRGIVDENGNFVFGSGSLLLFGEVTPYGETHGEASATGTEIFYRKAGSADFGDFRLNGSFDQDVLAGDYVSSMPGKSGWLRLTKQWWDTNRSVSLQDLRGNWTAYSYVSGRSYSLTLESDGSFSGSLGECRSTGKWQIPNPELNVLSGYMNLSTACTASTHRRFDGLGLLYVEDPDIRDDDYMVWIGWNGADDFSLMQLERD